MDTFSLTDSYADSNVVPRGGGISDDIETWAKENWKLTFCALMILAVLCVYLWANGYVVKKENLSNPTSTLKDQKNEWGLGGAEHASSRDGTHFAQSQGAQPVFLQKNMDKSYVLSAPEFDCANRVAASGDAWAYMNAEAHAENACVKGSQGTCDDNRLTMALTGAR